MPRLPHALIRYAALQHPYLPSLLRACRDIHAAKLELRWLYKHAKESVQDHLRKQVIEYLQEHGQEYHKDHVREHVNYKVHQNGPVHVAEPIQEIAQEFVEKAVQYDTQRYTQSYGLEYSQENIQSVPQDDAQEANRRGDAETDPKNRRHVQRSSQAVSNQQLKLWNLCQARARGVPLQYLIGTEYFGPLEIKCRPGVLIPRQATADAVSNLLELIRYRRCSLPRHLTALDLCSGTGCMSLLLAYEFPFQETGVERLDICGIDISSVAIRLAQANQRHVISQLQKQPIDKLSVNKTTINNIKYLQGDILSHLANTSPIRPEPLESVPSKPRWDIIVSNPPYVSPESFRRLTSRSVRNYEPKLALVPEADAHLNDDDWGDLFYPSILQLARASETKLLLLEVSDMSQAQRVANMALRDAEWSSVEIWRDDPRKHSEALPEKTISGVPVIGSGEGRSVLCWKAEASSWIGRST
jgi:HemK-like putative methylase